MYEYRLRFRVLAVVLCFLLAGTQVLPAAAQSSAPPKSLQIVILDGEGALNNIKQRTAHEPIVQVQDENHKPVAGAIILFLLPDSGASGTFADGSRMLSTVTDTEGKAVAHGLIPNKIAGQYQIQVRASYSGLHAETTINQTNVNNTEATPAHVSHPLMKWILIGSTAAAGIAIGIWASQRSSSGTTITAGSPTVGAPASIPVR